MFNSVLVATVLATTFLAATSFAKPPVTRRGTAVSHYQTRNTLSATDAEPAAAGNLRLQSNVQGHSAKESFRLAVSGLTAETTYQLVAITGEETNSVPVDEFTTDKRGRATVVYSQKGNGNGNGNSKKNNLPAELNPLYNLRAIGVANETNTTVLVTWINTSTAYQYLVKRNLTASETNSMAAGSISLHSNAVRTKFKLLAGGLSATNEYHLALNGTNIVQTVSSDDYGRLSISEWPASAPAVLDLRSLSLLDASSNVVLTTSLPR